MAASGFGAMAVKYQFHQIRGVGGATIAYIISLYYRNVYGGETAAANKRIIRGCASRERYYNRALYARPARVASAVIKADKHSNVILRRKRCRQMADMFRAMRMRGVLRRQRQALAEGVMALSAKMPPWPMLTFCPTANDQRARGQNRPRRRRSSRP